MHKTIVIAFSTIDGITEDPDGSGGSPSGGWAFRHGPEAVAGESSGSDRFWTPACCCWGGGPGSCSPISGLTGPTSSQRQ